MPLPDSGPLSVSQIRTELSRTGTVSLQGLSADAASTLPSPNSFEDVPHSISEFYGLGSILLQFSSDSSGFGFEGPTDACKGPYGDGPVAYISTTDRFGGDFDGANNSASGIQLYGDAELLVAPLGFDETWFYLSDTDASYQINSAGEIMESDSCADEKGGK